MDYWEECVSEAFDDAKITATADQIKIVASWIEGAHENFGMAHGHEVASTNLWGAKEREIADLKKKLDAEEDKVPCPECEGKWAPGMNGTREPARYTCWKCDGSGKVPSWQGRQSR